MLQLIVALLLALGAVQLQIVDETGAPVSGATVRFVAASGAVDVEKTGVDGRATARDGFPAVRASIENAGFAPLALALGGIHGPVVLRRQTGVIGVVRVATGSQQSLHRLAFPASLLDTVAVANSPQSTSDALLRNLPGFDRDRSNSAFTNYGQLRVSFDGAGNDRGVVLADGIPAQDAFGGQVDWQALPAGNITRAELLRGSGSALYGSGAVGGVLALDTRSPAPGTPPNGWVSGGGGGLASSNGELFYRTPLAPKVDASLWTSTTQSAYYDAPPADRTKVDQIANSQSDATELRVRAASGGSTWEAEGLMSTDAQRQGRPNYTFGRSLWQESLRWSHGGARTVTDVLVYNRDTTVLNIADQFPRNPGVLQYVQHVPSWESGVYAAWTATGQHFDLEARADERSVHGISDQRAATGALQTIGSGSQTLGGIALQGHAHGGRLDVVAGARYDKVTFYDGKLVSVANNAYTVTAPPAQTNAAVSPRAALRYDLSPAVAFRASDGGAFRAPYLNELVRGFVVAGVQMAPNPQLVPERSSGTNAGFDIVTGQGRSRFTFDEMTTGVNNAIAFLTINPTLQQRANVARTRTDGAIATYATLLAPCTRLRLSGQTQYARITAGPAADVAKRLAFVPDRLASATLETQAGPVRYAFDASFLGQTYADDLNTQLLPSTTLYGARMVAPFYGGGTLTISATNVTNRIYLSSVDRLGPPSSVQFQLAFPAGRRAAAPVTNCFAP